MRIKLISFVVAISIVSGAAQLPLAWAQGRAASVQTSHPCCPKHVERDLIAPISSLPCGPAHGCCSVRPPAKLPSLPGRVGGNPDRCVLSEVAAGVTTLQHPLKFRAASARSAAASLGLSTILRV